MNKKKLLLHELIGMTVGGIAGGILGYKLGAEAVEYAKTITENADIITYMVANHPTLSKLTSLGVVGGAGGKLGQISAKLEELVYTIRNS